MIFPEITKSFGSHRFQPCVTCQGSGRSGHSQCHRPEVVAAEFGTGGWQFLRRPCWVDQLHQVHQVGALEPWGWVKWVKCCEDMGEPWGSSLFFGTLGNLGMLDFWRFLVLVGAGWFLAMLAIARLSKFRHCRSGILPAMSLASQTGDIQLIPPYPRHVSSDQALKLVITTALIQSNVFSFCDSQRCAKQIQRTVLNNLKQGPCIFNSLFVATKPASKRWLNIKKKRFSAAEVEVADFPHARSLFLDFQHRFLFLSAYESPGCKGVWLPLCQKNQPQYPF